MENNTKGAIAVGITLLAIGTAYYFLVYKKNNGEGDEGSNGNNNGSGNNGLNNFDSLQKNLGAKALGDRVSVKFNENKNTADFYNNNRVSISRIGTSGYLVKGSYSDGGKTIKLDNGKEISSGSVWGNLLQTLK